MRRKISLGMVVGGLAIVGLSGCQGGEALGPGVTRARIRAVRLGMTEDEVVRLLGEPLGTGPHRGLGDKTFEYARRVPRQRWFPMLWVHFKDGRVIEVYAKRYVWWGNDDYGVYSLSSTGHSERRAFESTFPR